MEKISAVVLVYNDEQRIEKLIKSLRGVDEIIISLDDKTTDKTKEIAERLGARVVKRSDYWEHPNPSDITYFEKEFGFSPVFITKDSFCRWSSVRNEAASYCKNDWVFFPDSDEFVEWNLKEVEKLLFGYDMIDYRFYSDKSTFFTHCKLYRKSRCKWSGDIHEVVVPTMLGTMSVYTDHIKLHHEKAERTHRGDYLSRLEFAYMRKKEVRTLFYLAREYFYKERYEDSIKVFQKYLALAWWVPEKAEANYFLAQCYWKLQEGDTARKYCFEAIHLNPDFKRALLLASEMHFEPWKSKWKFIADNATNKDVVFG